MKPLAIAGASIATLAIGGGIAALVVTRKNNEKQLDALPPDERFVGKLGEVMWNESAYGGGPRSIGAINAVKLLGSKDGYDKLSDARDAAKQVVDAEREKRGTFPGGAVIIEDDASGKYFAMRLDNTLMARVDTTWGQVQTTAKPVSPNTMVGGDKSITNLPQAVFETEARGGTIRAWVSGVGYVQG